jgi:ABC-type spermidine/putrescine transport system permease subunit II
MLGRYALRAVVACIGLILLFPIVILVILSFSGESYLHFPPRSWSLRWFQRFFGDEKWQMALWTSLFVGLVSCLIASFVGFLGAYALVRGRFAGKRMLMSLVLMPIIVPQIITSIAIYFLSVKLGLVGNRLWIAICHAMLALPIVVVVLISALHAVDINLERAALGLGASRMLVFRRIVLPLAMPGVISAALFAFLASFDELIVALFLSGVTSETLPVRIWNSLQMSVDPTVVAVSTVFIGVTVFVLLVDWLIRRRRARALETSK